MSRHLVSLLALILFPVFLLFASITYANHIAAPSGYVNDFADVLTKEQETALEDSLKNYEQTTTNEIAVATVKNLNGDPIEDFAVKVFEEWKIGKKSKDNGILFIAAIEDRKMRIEIGYGLEPDLTDSQAGEIIRNIIAPKFKKEDYYGGIYDGVLAIEDHLSKNPAEVARGQAKVTFWSVFKVIFEVFGEFILFFILFLIYLLFSYVAAFFGRSKEVWPGGVVGGGLGGFLGWIFGAPILILFIIIAVTGGLGYLLDVILSRNYQTRKAKGLSTSWWSSGGGFSSGGGGFGGGFSGGGGSSGSW